MDPLREAALIETPIPVRVDEVIGPTFRWNDANGAQLSVDPILLDDPPFPLNDRDLRFLGFLGTNFRETSKMPVLSTSRVAKTGSPPSMIRRTSVGSGQRERGSGRCPARD